MDRGKIGSLAGSDLESELVLLLGGSGGLEMAETNFLGSLEIPLS